MYAKSYQKRARFDEVIAEKKTVQNTLLHTVLLMFFKCICRDLCHFVSVWASNCPQEAVDFSVLLYLITIRSLFHLHNIYWLVLNASSSTACCKTLTAVHVLNRTKFFS